MVDSNAQHKAAVLDFHKWRHSSEAQLPGVGGPGMETTCRFIPRSTLDKYFAKDRRVEELLDAVLESHERSTVDASYVRHHYLQSFAILLCVGQGPMIRHFQQNQSLRDQHLPHRTQPHDFPMTEPAFFEAFKNAQWQFCAPKLEYGMDDRFKEEDILPVVRKEKIGEGGSAIIYKIVVNEDYNSLRPSIEIVPDHRRNHRNTFVLKTYRSSEAKKNYDIERRSYMRLRFAENPSPYIVAYYGGFVHGSTYNIILEYADQGTLEDFIRDTPTPSTIEDILLFWDRLFNIIHGVMNIHGLMTHDGKTGKNSSASQILFGLHQDINPANILVFSGSGNSLYDRYFKIADLGLTQFKPSVLQPGDPSHLAAFGTRAYSAPEAFRSHPDTESSPLQITQAADMWSIGCVLSELSVWACHGSRRVAEYRRRREMEVEDKGGDGGERLFHLDCKLLDVVNEIHQDIQTNTRACDHTTRLVLENLVDDILQSAERPNAKFIFEKSKRLIKRAEKRFEVSVSRLGGNTSSDYVDSNVAKSRPRTPPQVPPQCASSPKLSPNRDYGSQLKVEVPIRESLVTDANLELSRLSLGSHPSLYERHHKSPSQSSNQRSNDGIDTLGAFQANGQGTRVTPEASPFTVASTHTQEDVGTGNSQLFGRRLVQQHGDDRKPPILSIEEGHEWKRKKKDGAHGAKLAGSENLTYLHERDHIFLIDNSKTMKQHRSKTQKVVSLLAYMLKKQDKDGLDILFTQSSLKINSRKTKDLLRAIDRVDFEGISDMRGRLSGIFSEHISKFGTEITPPKSLLGRQPPSQAQKRLSFYILTDAKWQPKNDVEGYIKDILVQEMQAKHCPKEHVAIQFIRFNDDQESIDKLDKLDHGLGLKAVGMDIVDHTYWNGNVWKMLLGALNDWYDDDPP